MAMNKYIYILFVWLCSLSAFAQTDGYNPNNPPIPDWPRDTTYVLTVNSSPSGSGSISTPGGQYKEGTSIYISAYDNGNFHFMYWIDDEGNTISTSAGFYYVMPKRNAVITAVYKYSPSNPSLPDNSGNTYNLTLETKPAGAGSFNTSSTSLKEGESIHLYAYSNSNFYFKHWEDALGNIVSTAQNFYYIMPAVDTQLYAIYTYNPSNPSNPGKNYYDSFTGEVIIDDFTKGNLSSAIYDVTKGNTSNVTSITVAGKINDNDFSIANNYSNCAIVDLSRTTGVYTVPYNIYRNNNHLNRLMLPASINLIEGDAFYNSSLTELTCYSPVPPKLESEDNAFPKGLVVYVPASSLELYMNAAGRVLNPGDGILFYAKNWKDYIEDGTITIMPIQSQVSSLEVNLPTECADGRYKNMPLELLNVKSGQKYKYVVTDRINYTFNNLVNGTRYVASLKNLSGQVLAKTDTISIANENVSVTFDLANMKQLRSVKASILTNEGTDVTSNCVITWYDANGTFLSQSKSLEGQVSETKVKCAVSLSQALAMEYVLPTDSLYEILEGDNNVSFTLVPLPKMQLSGRILDVTTQQAISNANVTISQTLNGKYSKSFTAKTDNKGAYTITVFAAPTSVTYASNDYVSQTIELADSIINKEACALADVKLKPISGATITTNFTYTNSVAAGVEPDVQNYYSDYNNVAYNIYNVTAQKEIRQFNVQYPNIVLLEEVNEGDSLTIVAQSKNGSFKDITTGGHIDSTLRMTVEVPVVQWGGVDAAFTTTENNKVLGVLYDSKGAFVNKYNYGSATLSIRELKDGEYTLVTMGASDFFGSIYNIEKFSEAGLQQNIDYLVNKVTVKSGIISPLKNVLVPFFDESKFYYTGDNTSFTVNKTSIVAGNYLTLTAKVDFKEVYKNSISDVKVSVELPEGTTMVDNSVMVGSDVAFYELNGNTLTIPLDNNVSSDRVRFCVIPTTSGSFAPNATVAFKLGDKSVSQPMGSVAYDVESVAIKVPEITSDSIVTIQGLCVANADVEIYDGNVLIGKTKSLANGFWTQECLLYDTFDASYHHIYAVIKKNDAVYETENKLLSYTKNEIDVLKTTMLYNSAEIVFDYRQNTTAPTYYSYAPSQTTFTFLTEFSANDTTKICNVEVHVQLSDNTCEILDAYYSEKQNAWIAIGDFPNSNAIPVNCYVDFEQYPSMVLGDERNDKQYDSLVEFHSKMYDTLDENMEVDCLLDEDEELQFIMNDSKYGYTVHVEEIKNFTFNEGDYVRVETEDGFFYISDQLDTDIYQLILVEDNKEAAWMLTMTPATTETKRSIGIKKAVSIPDEALVDFNVPDDVDWLHFLPFVGYMYEVFNCYNYWIERLPKDINHLIDLKQNVFDKLLAKCPDGTYKLTNNQRDNYYKRIQSIDNLISSFQNTGYNTLEVWRKKLIGSFCFDAVTMGAGKILKVIPNIKVFYKSSKGGGAMGYLIKGGKQKREFWEKMIEGGFNVGGNIHTGEEIVLDENMTRAFGSWEPNTKAQIMRACISLEAEIMSSYKKCGKDKKPHKKDDKKKHKNDPVKPSIDPSGFVYEGVSSNRLQGVTATAYYKEIVEDMYGDLHENIVLWDAEEYAQKNPLFTDENGMYQWDVPQGLWQVRFEKEGYVPTQSEWLPVPPPQMDVNIGMVQNAQPEVVSARAYEDGVEIEFSKYMNIESLNSENVYLKVVNGEGESLITDAEIQMMNKEVTIEGSTTEFASKIKLATDQLGYYDEAYIIVSTGVNSYAGIPMAETFEQKLDVEKKVRELLVDAELNVEYDGQKQITIAALPADAAAGKKLTITSASDMIATTDVKEVIFDADGQATFTVNGELYGATALNYSLVDGDLKATSLINVVDSKKLEAVKAPVASRISGTAVYRGQTVTLSCESEGAVIYYTTDGSCPCDESKRMKYERPIAINDAMNLKFMAIGTNFDESDVVECSYSIRQSDVKLNLVKGWNWSSHDVASPVGVNELSGVASRILTQTDEVIDDPVLGFVGTLTTIDGSETMKIEAKESATKSFTGEQYNPALSPIVLHEGWNWLGYPISQTMTVADALSYMDADEGDCISNLDGGFATYTGGQWIGSLETMNPGAGYLYKSAMSKSFIYNNVPMVQKAKALYGHRLAPKSIPWSVDKHRYPNLMPVIAQVCYSNGDAADSTYYVGAFVGEECRGVGKYSDGIMYLSVYGDKAAEMNFKAWNVETGSVYGFAETLKFTPDVVGTYSSPYRLMLGFESTGIDSINANNGIDGIYNVQGIKLNSMPKSGIYIIKSTDENGCSVMKKTYVK